MLKKLTSTRKMEKKIIYYKDELNDEFSVSSLNLE